MLNPTTHSLSQPVRSNLQPAGCLELLLTEVLRLAGQAQRTGLLGRTESQLLIILNSIGPQTVPQVARRLNRSRQSIQMIINRLQRQGWVELISNPAHQRSSLIRLSNSGQEAAKTAAEQTKQLLPRLADQLNPDEVASAAATLSQLGQLLANLGRNRPSTVRKRPKDRRDTKRSPAFKPKDHESPSLAGLPALLATDQPGDQDSFPVNLL